jgi:RNA-directed DNA polymerase
MSKTSINNNTRVEWDSLPWRKLERRIFKLQKRIYQATKRGDVKSARGLQRLLTKSWAAKCLAVRRVTQENKGKKTAGVDGVKSITSQQRLRMIENIKLSNRAKPTRRVWIPKPGSYELRPLGIPTLEERAKQTLVKFALEPEWEAKFEPNSYGFRPGRRCHDAIAAIRSAINRKPKYVLDADIKGCFDNINHQKLLDKIKTYPTLRKQIKAWLKAGIIDKGVFEKSRAGTPQGGTLSPLLANIALHGMENSLKEIIAGIQPIGRHKSRRDRMKALSAIRYADDFVILHEDIKVIQVCKNYIQEWLKDIGLELKPSKTRITHTLHEYEGNKPGFDFLGFNIRHYETSRNKAGKDTAGRPKTYASLVKPSKESIKKHYEKVAEIIDSHVSLRQEALIGKLNPVIRGWTNYFATENSSEVFKYLKNLTYLKLVRWARKRHPNKPAKWLQQKYWGRVGNKNWAFKWGELTLREHTDTRIVKHIKIREDKSPFDGDEEYWKTRYSKDPYKTEKVKYLLNKQEEKCNHCKINFHEGERVEIDHIIPLKQGGSNRYSNLQLLHKQCHLKKTASETSSSSTNANSHINEERYEAKVSRTVLKTSSLGDEIA